MKVVGPSTSPLIMEEQVGATDRKLPRGTVGSAYVDVLGSNIWTVSTGLQEPLVREGRSVGAETLAGNHASAS